MLQVLYSSLVAHSSYSYTNELKDAKNATLVEV